MTLFCLSFKGHKLIKFKSHGNESNGLSATASSICFCALLHTSAVLDNTFCFCSATNLYGFHIQLNNMLFILCHRCEHG
jgi:hypothetical protein